MTRLILFESGSTKTTVLIQASENWIHPNGEVIDTVPLEIILPGYNPNRPSALFVQGLKNIQLTPKDTIYFYGSGLGAVTNKDKVIDLFQEQFKVDINVFDDILGAGHALYGDASGVLAIMGTGGCAAYYNGTLIEKRVGGYGYLIDDLGGGYELGKEIVSKWLNGYLPVEVAEILEKHFKNQPNQFVAAHYDAINKGQKEKALGQMAEVTKLIAPYIHLQEIHDLVKKYFLTFFEKHIIPLTKDVGCNELRCVGSLANAFEPIIKKIAEGCNIHLTKIVKYPGIDLFNYNCSVQMKKLKINEKHKS